MKAWEYSFGTGRSAVVAFACVGALLSGPPAAGQLAHCQPETAALETLTERDVVDALDVGPRKNAERGVIRIRPCPRYEFGDRPPRPAGSERFSMQFTSPTSSTLSAESRDALAKAARAFQTDALIGFAFRVEVSVPPSGDLEANLALSVKRAESVITVLTSEHGLPAKRFIAVGLGAEYSVTPDGEVSFVTVRQKR